MQKLINYCNTKHYWFYWQWKCQKKFTGIINNVQYTLVGGMQPNDLNNLNDMYKQSGEISETIKSYIAKASQGKFWFKISKQEQLPIQVLQIDDEVEIVANT